ncbi:hypothetical protein LPB144_06690 [Christiangramia salexigens]|uniref:Methyltransferase type 11 n=1 Tax=Christiangramia salexigens TaxID=1913577 RepID=A0A1L3J4S1_9FLAO|nr:hypothetical protein LPB144_06690 [Christiangramia salexigens]
MGEAYNSGAISALDTGILSRNLDLTNKTEEILLKLYSDFSGFKGLDYGGGEGITVRMLRDRGFNFYRYDLYAQNLYAKFFDLNDLPPGIHFNILTAFEVFEHLKDPIEEIEKMFNYSDTILFSTELIPYNSQNDLYDWWYLVPEGGQHISFYDKKTLHTIAGKFHAKFFTNNTNLHILSKNSNLKDPFDISVKQINVQKSYYVRLRDKLRKMVKPRFDKNAHKLESLIQRDFEMVKRKINTNDN